MAKFFKDIEVKGLSDNLVTMLDNARQIAGIPFIINSGLRSVENNEKVGGVSDSSHLKGLGADIRCLDSEQRYKIIRGALASGFTRIGIGKGHVHLDCDESKQQWQLFVE